MCCDVVHIIAIIIFLHLELADEEEAKSFHEEMNQALSSRRCDSTQVIALSESHSAILSLPWGCSKEPMK